MIEKNCQGVAPDPAVVEAEITRLSRAVDAFAQEMKQKLVNKAREGWSGWDQPGAKDKIYHAILAHGAGIPFAKDQEVDIANLAMMLWLWNNHQVEIAEPHGNNARESNRDPLRRGGMARCRMDRWHLVRPRPTA